ncbi:MAG: NAD(P)-dependent glycerol-3-phosphate dehydrogenase [Clostridia bacterium]|jgi:glycerol-3-phosphate dehydrogenase (NAD(P)+)|nr:NAD(P)-dependent glycerol-3-phosphate dehydrogenase [Clostridia bacterium]
MSKVAVMGAGSFGTALAMVLADNQNEVSLWSFDENQKDEMLKTRMNKEYTGEALLQENIGITNSIEDAIGGKDVIILALPSKFFRENLEKYKKNIIEKQIIVSASKGLDFNTSKRLSQVINEILPENRVAVLSGPTHAEEIVKKQPTYCMVASENKYVCKNIKEIFEDKYFKIETSVDVIGVELGGVFKNIVALAAGIAEGLGYGDNTKAALITKGVEEISLLGESMGACKETFYGLSGYGDLIVTSISEHSRNKRAGKLIASGKTMQQVNEEIKMVVEGFESVKIAEKLKKTQCVNMPIQNVVYRIVCEGQNAKKTFEKFFENISL